MVGQRGFIVPAVWQNPEAVIDQPLVIHLFERPDHRFHELGVHGLVIVLEIHPARLPRHVMLPLGCVLHDAPAGRFVERADADTVRSLDLRFIGDPKGLFRF